VKVPYVGATSKAFGKRLSQLVDQEFDLKLCAESRVLLMLSAPMSFTNLRVCVIQTLLTLA